MANRKDRTIFKVINFGVYFILFLISNSCFSQGLSTRMETTSSTMSNVRLLQQIFEKNEPKNLAISPLSIESILKVLQQGALGDTKKLLDNALDVRKELALPEVPNEKNLIFKFSTSLWGNPRISFSNGFIRNIKQCCNASVEVLDRKSGADDVNNWVKKITDGKIPGIVENLGSEVSMILVSAAYFHGAWTNPFNSSQTKNAQFTLSDGAHKDVTMMTQDGTVLYVHEADFEFVRLPYGDGNVVMDLLLPKNLVKLSSLIPTLLKIGSKTDSASIKAFSGRVNLPRFTITSSRDLKQAFERIGLNQIFELQKADFGAMGAGVGPIAIDEIKHKVFISVDEAGTKAAAATAATIIGGLPATKPPIDIRFDRPFLIAIRSISSDAVLFVATVYDPSNG